MFLHPVYCRCRSTQRRRLLAIRGVSICLWFVLGFDFTPTAHLIFAAGTFTPLGVFNGTRSRGHDISADGSVVVGTAYQQTTDTFSLFHWTRDGSTFNLGGSYDSAAVSANGAVVVGTL